MMEGKWTKGGWHVGSSTGHNANMVYQWGAPGDPLADEAVAQVFLLPSHQTLAAVAEDPRYAEGLARARLIAQAPAMAEALEDITRWAEERGYDAPVTRHARALLTAIKGE